MVGKGLALAMLVLLASCAAPPADLPLGRSAPAAAPIDARLAAVSVEPAGPALWVYPLPPELAPLLPRWRVVLEDALSRRHLFRASAQRQLALDVTVLEFALRGHTLTVFARYRLVPATGGSPLFSADIQSSAGVTSLYELAVTSLEHPASATSDPQRVDRAIRGNIGQFLTRLEAFAAGRSPKPSAAPVPGVTYGMPARSPASSRL